MNSATVVTVIYEYKDVNSDPSPLENHRLLRHSYVRAFAAHRRPMPDTKKAASPFEPTA